MRCMPRTVANLSASPSRAITTGSSNTRRHASRAITFPIPGTARTRRCIAGFESELLHVAARYPIEYPESVPRMTVTAETGFTKSRVVR